ncbi:hypothetical protein GPECTOR_31g340 [Gonium pectorale]|uniref:Protein kinase domain-containing protein n=1 Tax=Gonium pectorale TaxID=33097 RepID=A0A150GDU3_GONPE|nr:hypothetical protein GPECTOR_31g340 [Gonium pectorale]|eukprot:KXZ47978.1 hypothetical protein GPECTOR_31g340 [Gonium pectorale]
MTSRPPWLPGTQRYAAGLPQPGCVNTSSSLLLSGSEEAASAVPLERRCWQQVGFFEDIAVLAFDLDANQKQVYKGYGCHAINTAYACAAEVSYACVEELGTLGCMVASFKRDSAELNSPGGSSLGSSGGPSSRQPEAPPPAPSPGVALGGGGGATLVAAAVTLGVVILRRRRGLTAAGHTAGKEAHKADSGHCAGAHGTTGVAAKAGQHVEAREQCSSYGTPASGATRSAGTGREAASSTHSDFSPVPSEDAVPAPFITVTVAEQGTGRAAAAAPSRAVFRASPAVPRPAPFASASASAAVISSHTPPRADVPLDVKPGPAGEVTLLPTVLGKGGFGRVVEGLYGGQCVAVKLILDLSLDTWGLPADAATATATSAQGATTGGRLASDDKAAAKHSLEDTGKEMDEDTDEGKDNQAGAGGDVDAAPRTRECSADSGPEQGPHACDEDRGAAEAQGGGAGRGRPAAEAGRAGAMGTVVAQLAAALAQEVEVLSRCHHPNIVTLLAACLTPPRLCLVLERCETSLDKLLYGRPGQLLPMEQVVSIALDVARGLEYLHPTVVHRDLKPANVLVNHPGGPNMVAKVADFGLSRLRDTVAVATANPEVGTPEFMAPELYAVTNNIVTNKVDGE